MNYTLELRLKDEEGTVVWKATNEMTIDMVCELGFGTGGYGDGEYGDSEAPQ